MFSPLATSGRLPEHQYYVDVIEASGGYSYFHAQALTAGISTDPPTISLTTSIFEIGMYFRNEEVFEGQSVCPLYVSYSPYHRLVKPSREWTIARPILYFFAGGSAWGSKQTKYFRVGAGFSWTAWLGKADDRFWDKGPVRIGAELGWISLKTNTHYVNETKEDLGPGSHSSLYAGVALGFSGWLSPTVLKSIKEEQKEAEAKIEEKEMSVEETMEEFSSQGRIHLYWRGRLGYGSFHKFALKDRDGSPFWYSDNGKTPQAVGGVLAVQRDKSTLGLEIFRLDSEHVRDWDPDEREMSFSLFALFGRQTVWQSSFLSLAPYGGIGYAWMQGERFIPGSGLREREYTVERADFGILVGAKSRLEKKNGTIFAWRPFLDAEWGYMSSLSGLYSETYRAGFAFQGIEDMKTVIKRLEAGLFFDHVAGSEVELSAVGLCALLYFR